MKKLLHFFTFYTLFPKSFILQTTLDQSFGRKGRNLVETMRFNRHELPIRNRYLIRRLSGHLVSRSRSAFLAGRFFSTYPKPFTFLCPGITHQTSHDDPRACILRRIPTHLPPDKKSAAVCQYSLPGVRDPGQASVLCFVFLENGRLVPFIVAFVRPLPHESVRRRPGGSQR